MIWILKFFVINIIFIELFYVFCQQKERQKFLILSWFYVTFWPRSGLKNIRKTFQIWKNSLKNYNFGVKFWYFALKNNIFDDLSYFHRSKNANNNFKLIILVFFGREAAGKIYWKSFGFKRFNKWCQLDLKTAAKRSKNYKVALLEFKEYFDKNHKRRRNFWFFKKIRKRRDTCSHHICTRREEQALFIIGRSYRNHEKNQFFIKNPDLIIGRS